MEIRKVKAAQGARWIIEAWKIYRANPAIWGVMAILYLAIAIFLSLPFLFPVGSLVLSLIAPVLVAGYMSGCKVVESGQDLEVSQLFAGFRHNTTKLIAIGGMVLIASILIKLMLDTVGGEHMQQLFDAIESKNRDAINAAMEYPEVSRAVWLGLISYSLVIMAYWFCPPMIYFQGVNSLRACKASLLACWRNWLPIGVYLVVATLTMVGFVSILALLSTGLLAVVSATQLGTGLVVALSGLAMMAIIMAVVVPMILGTLYTSYRDIFGAPELPAGEAEENDSEVA